MLTYYLANIWKGCYYFLRPPLRRSLQMLCLRVLWAGVSWAKFKIQSTVAATAGTFVCRGLNYFLFRKFYGFQFVFKWNPVESELVSQWMGIRDNWFPTVSAPRPLLLWPGHCTVSI